MMRMFYVLRAWLRDWWLGRHDVYVSAEELMRLRGKPWSH
jgi:hypothetical protein